MAVLAAINPAWGSTARADRPTLTPSDRTGWGAVPVAARGPVSASLGADQPAFRVHRGAGGLVAADRPQQLRAVFGRAGISIFSRGSSFGLRLAGIGDGSSLAPVGPVAPTSHANRVSFSHPSVGEWWANGPAGLEQGFTVARPLPTSGPLTLALRISGDLRASLSDGGRALSLSRGGRAVLSYGGLVASDARGRSLRSWLELSGSRLVIRVDARGAMFPVRIDPLVQLAKLTASDGTRSDSLGTSVAVSADGSIVVAGAPRASVDAPNQGAVYVFMEPGSGWSSETRAAKLTASDGTAYAYLGQSVAVSSDGSTVVAGAPSETVGSNAYQGAVYVFTKPGSTWSSETQTAKLTASDGTANDSLGLWVAVSSDGATVVAGDPQASVGGNAYQGAVYVFTKPGSTWSSETQTAKLTASDGTTYDLLGQSVAVSSDGSTVVASACGATVGANSGQGAMYVFTEPGSAWSSETQAAKLTASDGTADAYLGQSVAVSSDGATVVAGDPQASVGGNAYQGAVYVFTKPGSAWSSETQTAKLTASDGTANDVLGCSVAMSSDGTTVVAGAYNATVGANSGQGAVYVFTEPGSAWSSETQAAKLTASDGATNDSLGYSVAASSDGSTVVAGASGATVGTETSQGAAYMFGSLTSSAVSVSAPASDTAGSAISASSVSASLSGGSSPTGTITFKVFGPQSSAPTDCSGGTTVGTAAVLGPGSYNPSAGFTPPGAGDYWWYASYGGDPNSHSAASTCGAGMDETVARQAAPTNSAPPTVSGAAQEGQTLTESHGQWSENPTSYAYEWEDCDPGGNNCATISGAASPTYTLTKSDVGHTIRVVETASNTGGSAAAASAPTGAVTAPSPSDMKIDTSGSTLRSGSRVDPGIRVSCPAAGSSCTATENVTVMIGTGDMPMTGRHSGATHPMTVGGASFTIGPGAVSQAAFQLTKLGMTLLSDHRRVALQVSISGHAEAQSQVTASKTISLTGRFAHYKVTAIAVHPNGVITFKVKVSAPGRVNVLVTARKKNIVGAARTLHSAPGRLVLGRATAIAKKPGVLSFAVRPDAKGRYLLAHRAYPVGLRLWVSYIPRYAVQEDAGYGLHPGRGCTACRTRR